MKGSTDPGRDHRVHSTKRRLGKGRRQETSEVLTEITEGEIEKPSSLRSYAVDLCFRGNERERA